MRAWPLECRPILGIRAAVALAVGLAMPRDRCPGKRTEALRLPCASLADHPWSAGLSAGVVAVRPSFACCIVASSVLTVNCQDEPSSTRRGTLHGAAQVGAATPLESWSEWGDLNSRPLAPHASALPGCATLRPGG